MRPREVVLAMGTVYAICAWVLLKSVGRGPVKHGDKNESVLTPKYGLDGIAAISAMVIDEKPTAILDGHLPFP